MFGNPAMVVDEFRELLKAWVRFDEQTGSADSEKLSQFSKLAGVSSSLALSWAQGLARPVPHEERTVVAMIKSIGLHAPVEVVQSGEPEGNPEPQ